MPLTHPDAERLAFNEIHDNSTAGKVLQHKPGQKPQNASEVFTRVKGLVLDKVGLYAKLSSCSTSEKISE